MSSKKEKHEMIKEETEKENVETLPSGPGASVSEPRILQRSKCLKTVSGGLNLSSLNLNKLLSLDVPMRDCLLPKLSFKDLASLEMTSTACRATIASKSFWKDKFDDWLLEDEQARKLFSRYPEPINTTSLNYHKRLIEKLITDIRRIKQNLKEKRCRTDTMFFPVEMETCPCPCGDGNVSIMETCQVNHGEMMLFAFQDTTIEVYTTGNTHQYSTRGTNLKHLKSFACFQSGYTSKSLKVYEEFLFHLTDNKLTIYNWKEGTKVPVPSLDQNDVMGLGDPQMMLVKEGHLIIGSYTATESYDGSLAHIWAFTYPDLTFTPVKTIREQTIDRGIMFDLDSHLVCFGYGSRCGSYCGCCCGSYAEDWDRGIQADGPAGKLLVYDLKTKTAVNEVQFPNPITKVLVNKDQRRVLVAFRVVLPDAQDVHDYVPSNITFKMLDVQTGNVLQEFVGGGYDIHCLWTDWREYIMYGGCIGMDGAGGCLLVWDMKSGIGEASTSATTSLPMVEWNGCNADADADAMLGVFHISFDGSRMLRMDNTHRSVSVSVLDFLNNAIR